MPHEIGLQNGSTFIPHVLEEKDISSYIQAKKALPTPATITHSGLPSTFVSGFHDEGHVRRMRYNKLGGTGMDISALSFGGGGLERFYRSLDEDHAIDSIHHALRLGVNYIHTAPWYGGGKSEALLGKALSVVPRQAYFIATKVGRYSGSVEEMFDFSAKRVTASLEESLTRLGLSCVDVIQIHDLEFAPNLDIILNETLPALEKAVKDGKARFIGITGYQVQTLLDVVRKSRVKIDTVHCFCRYGLYNNDLMEIIPELRNRDIGIINAAPLGLGLLSKGGPEEWHPANEFLKIACRAAVAYAHEVGSDLEKIVLKLCYNSSDVDTTVASMVCVERPDLVSYNVNTVLEAMTDEERNIVDDIKAKYFRALEKTHWEGEPVERYWEAVREEEAIKLHLHPIDTVMSKNAYALFSDPVEDLLLYRKTTI